VKKTKKDYAINILSYFQIIVILPPKNIFVPLSLVCKVKQIINVFHVESLCTLQMWHYFSLLYK